VKPKFYIKQNDRSPALVFQLSPVVNLTGASIYFNMRPAGGGTVVISRAVAAIVGDPTLGRVSYSWQAADTMTSGEFDAEFEVVYSVGAIPETFPNYDYIRVVITDDIA
jgi:hypothetical protein